MIRDICENLQLLSGKPQEEPVKLSRRISISPTMHTIGSIMREANEIMDEEEKRRVEDMFLL